MTAERPAPTWGEIVPFMLDNWEDLPDVQTPYYVQAKEGTFIHRRNATGRWITKHNSPPSRLKALGNWQGVGRFDAPRIPAHIYGQAVSFFRRIWFEHHTEAEVLITQHQETKEYRLFIPWQSVSHGGVHSIYNPAHIDPAYLVVGTFHSHCNFSEKHSGIDEADAKEMDGIHGTIGHVDRDVPGLDMMISSKGVLFFYNDPSNVVDMDLSANVEAPAWWDRYMLFERPTDADRPRIAPHADDKTWNQFMGRGRPKNEHVQTGGHSQQPTWNNTPVRAPSWASQPAASYWDKKPSWIDREDLIRWLRETETGAELSRESAEFNRDRQALIPLQTPLTNTDLLETDDETQWEETLGYDFCQLMYETGLFTEEDLDLALDNWPQSGTQKFWFDRFEEKLNDAVWFLAEVANFGIKVNITKPVLRLVPGQTGMDDFIEGDLLP